MEEDGIEKTQLVPTKRDRQERADTAQRVTSKQRVGGSSPSWRARENGLYTRLSAKRILFGM